MKELKINNMRWPGGNFVMGITGGTVSDRKTNALLGKERKPKVYLFEGPTVGNILVPASIR